MRCGPLGRRSDLRVPPPAHDDPLIVPSSRAVALCCKAADAERRLLRDV